MFWRLMLFYTQLQLLLQPSVMWLSIVTLNNDGKPPPKWILRAFDVSRIRPRLAWVTSSWNVDMAKFDFSWEDYLVWQTGLPTLKGDPTYHVHVNVIKLKWEIIWTGRLPHLSGLPFLPPPCKQALKVNPAPFLQFQQLNYSPLIIWVNLVPLESHF